MIFDCLNLCSLPVLTFSNFNWGISSCINFFERAANSQITVFLFWLSGLQLRGHRVSLIIWKSVYLFKTGYVRGLYVNFGALVTMWWFDWLIVPIGRIGCLIWSYSSIAILGVNRNTSSSHILVNICIRSSHKFVSSLFFRIFSLVSQRRSRL